MGWIRDNDCVGCETCFNCGRREDYVYAECDKCGTSEFLIYSYKNNMYCVNCLFEVLQAEGRIECIDHSMQLFLYDGLCTNERTIKTMLKEEYSVVEYDWERRCDV